LTATVYIVILNWNEWQDTSLCLSSLQELNYPSYQVVVVDQGSTDGSPERIRQTFPWVQVIENGKNLGFTGGCNVGMRYGLSQGADFVWLLNNDTTVDKYALGALVTRAESDSHIGAVGSAIYFMHEPERLQAWGGGYINFVMGRGEHFLRPVPDGEIEFITGASLLLPRKALEAVGPLDEGFFIYWEDADICFRLRKAGWKLAVAGDSKIWHKGHTSLGKGKVSSYKNFNASAARFFRKHAPMPLFSFWIGFGMRLGKRIVVGDWDKLRATWAGMKDGIRTT
jgi:GT2 family glycosyltransferase